MNLLDENVRQDQGHLLRRWGVNFRWLAREVARSGIKDPEVIPVLHRVHRATLLTHDADYFKRRPIHPSYSLVFLDVFDGQAAEYIRRFLRHPAFDTHARRLGKVIRVHAERISYYERRHGLVQRAHWPLARQ